MASLWEALKQYVSDVAPGGVLSPETPRLGSLLDYGKQKAQYIGGLLDPNSQVSQDVGSWHKKTQLGLADLLAGKETPAADYGYGQMMNMAGVAPLGLTAWHGSPHKFDKFSLDKIGTGEGAQAYGHGLYLAQEPAVATGYKMSNSHGVGKYAIDGKDALNAAYQDRSLAPAVKYLQDYGDTKLAKQYAAEFGDVSAYKTIDELEKSGRLVANPKPTEGNLYKTDIPDEAVARFLDWDKPLSQQAGIQIKPVSPVYNGQFGTGEYGGYAWHVGDTQVSRAYRTTEQAQKNAPLGSDLIRDLNAEVASPTGHQELLYKAGIPGIRYLDGGSRSAGQGSSNFVVFDDQLPRILERNGVPTGQQPWKPGEWQGLLGR